MKQAVVIATSTGREHWAKDALASIKLPTIVVSCGGYELGKIKWVYENTKLDRFIFLQDSVTINDNDLLASLFDIDGSCCLMCDPSHLGSYMGVYERHILDEVGIPDAKNKADSIIYETQWTSKYIEACDKFTHPIDIQHKMTHGQMKHGRVNMLYENCLYNKWKGNWGQYGLGGPD